MQNFVEFLITDKYNGYTIRDFLLIFEVSKKNIYKQEMFNLIRVNNKIEKLTYRLKLNDKLSFKLAPFDEGIEPFVGDVEIVYEDDDILIVNKPPRLLIHEDGNTKDTLTNRVSHYYHLKGYDYPVLPVHRIDYETSGIVLFAKHFISLAYLSGEFRDNKVKKTYIAICHGYFAKPDGVINLNIGKDRHSNKQIVIDSGKEARTEYFVLDQKDNLSRVEIHILEGRRHQIRVHLAYLGHPVVGDKLYGKDEGKRMLLHAKKLEFTHPRTLKTISFEISEPF